MFRDEEIAKHILQVFLSLNGQMDDAIRSVEHKTSPEEYKVFEQIVEPICKQHPSLRPPEMEA